MAIGDAISFALTTEGKKIIMQEAVKYTGTGNTSSTAVYLRVRLDNMTTNVPIYKEYQVNFSRYGFLPGGGVQIGGINVTDIPANYKLYSLEIHESAGGASLLIPITLTANEQKELPDGGIIHIGEIILDAVGGLS